MPTVINANMKLFADRMNITSSRMVNDYGLASVNAIIRAEEDKGNTRAVKYAHEYYHSPEKLIDYFELRNVENKFVLIHKMDDRTRRKVLPLLDREDLVMGLYFFTQEGLLKMLNEVSSVEMVKVILDALPFEKIIMMFKEEDLAEFFKKDELDRVDVMEQMKAMPPEVLKKFIEGVTGQPIQNTNVAELFRSIDQLPDDKFKKFMSSIDPDVQRQLTFQLTKDNPAYLTLFKNEAYTDMLATLQKPDMIKPMINLDKESLIGMIGELPDDLMSIVGAQIDTRELAKFIQKGHMNLIEDAWMI